MKTHWKFKIYLRGITKECKEFLSVYLANDNVKTWNWARSRHYNQIDHPPTTPQKLFFKALVAIYRQVLGMGKGYRLI